MGTDVLIRPPLEALHQAESSIAAALASASANFALLSSAALLASLDTLERISRALSMVQAAAAVVVQERNLAADPERHFAVASGDEPTGSPRSEFRNAAEFLQRRLRISKAEARRRIRLGECLLPRRSLGGEALPPRYEKLAAAARSAAAGSEALTLSVRALDEVAGRADEPTRLAMETSLSELASTQDPDFLRPAVQRWNTIIDQDGTAPSEAELKQRQGIWRMRTHRGLNQFQIWADQTQAEVLLTVMNAGTNPRTETADARGLDQRSLPQKHLDALVTAVKAALQTELFPRTGGSRPQLLATVGFKELLADFSDAETPAATTARLAFTGPINAKNLRALACDAEIIPVVFGGQGQVLDVGAGRRFFNRTQRLALIARDRGCSFPDCTIPASWCEAHHVDWWSRNPWTAVDNGALLCSHHHHLIHQGQWEMQIRSGIPWFIPPSWLDPLRDPRRNRFHQI